MKSAREQLDILTAYHELGSYRAAAVLCGTTHKTVRRVVERRTRAPAERPRRPKSSDPYLALIAERVRATDGRISAKRLLPLCRAAGYAGSPRHLLMATSGDFEMAIDMRRSVEPESGFARAAQVPLQAHNPIPGQQPVLDCQGAQVGLCVTPGG